MDKTMIDVLDATADRLPDGMFCRYGQRETRFGTFRQRARQLAGGLAGLGLAPGQRVAYLGKNTDRLLELVFGAAMARGTCVVMNWRLAAPEWQDIVADCGATLLFADHEFVAQALALADALPQIRRIVTIDAPPSDDPRLLDHDVLVAAAAPLPPQGVQPEDDFLQLYTSGTTGRPKGVPQTHAMHLSQRAQWEARLGPFPADDCTLVFMPCFHAAGISYPLMALAYGTRVELHRAAEPAAIFEALTSGRITTTVMVPTLMAMLLPQMRPGLCPGLRRIHYGASSIDPVLLARAMDVFSCELVQIYAATETTAALCILSPQDHVRALSEPGLLASAGKPGGDARLRVVDGQGRDVAPGEAGELVVRSGSVLRGYWRNPQASEEALKDGWYHTGDLGRIDAEGYVYIVDRVKDMIISGGENVYSSEVEKVLALHPGLAEYAIVGVPDAQWGELVTACVVPKPGQSVDLEGLQAFLRPHLAGYKLPRRLDVRSTLPRNPMGKLQKHLLRAELRTPMPAVS